MQLVYKFLVPSFSYEKLGPSAISFNTPKMRLWPMLDHQLLHCDVLPASAGIVAIITDVPAPSILDWIS